MGIYGMNTMKFLFFTLLTVSLGLQAATDSTQTSHVLIVTSQVTDYGGGWSVTSMQSFSTLKRCQDAANVILKQSRELLKRGNDETVKVECVQQ